MSYYNFLVTGTQGMKKSMWVKFKNAPFSVIMKESNRSMDSWECALITIEKNYCDENSLNPTQLFNDTIGKRIIKKYSIKID